MTRIKRSRPERPAEPEAVYVVVGDNLAADFGELSAADRSAVYGPPYEKWGSPEYLFGVHDYPSDVLKDAKAALRRPAGEPGPQVAIYARYEGALVSALLEKDEPVVHVQNEQHQRVAVEPEVAARFAEVVHDNLHPTHRRLLPLRAAIGTRLPDLVPATQTAERLAHATRTPTSIEDVVTTLDRGARDRLKDRRAAIESSTPAKILGTFNKQQKPGGIFGNAYALTSLVPRLVQSGFERVAETAIRRKAAASSRSNGGSGSSPKNRLGRS